MDSIEFAKLSGSGNDFICLDNRDGQFEDMLSNADRVGHFARSLCHRGVGVGADGLIFACRVDGEDEADIAARFFEADGSQAELCGNGTACFGHWAITRGWVDDGETRIMTSAGVVLATRRDGQYVRVCIPTPGDIQRNFELSAAGRVWLCDFAATGVPHVVTYIDDIDKAEMDRWGPALRAHPKFAPRGANANFVQVLSPGKIAIRTWEFGVEGETLSCGTGSAAAAILSALRFDWPEGRSNGERPVLVSARSGDVLRVYFTITDDGAAEDVCLETVVRFLYRGTVHPDLTAVAFDAKALSPSAVDES